MPIVLRPLLAAVEMGGATGGSLHRLQTSTDDRRENWIPGFEFHWLKIIAV